MKYKPFEVSIMALQEIGRNDLIYFILHQNSMLAGMDYVPHIDRYSYFRNKLDHRHDGELRVPYMSEYYSCSSMHVRSSFEEVFATAKLSHADKVIIKDGGLWACKEDLALVERAMFLGFKYAGKKYECGTCEFEFQALGVRLTKENSIL